MLTLIALLVAVLVVVFLIPKRQTVSPLSILTPLQSPSASPFQQNLSEEVEMLAEAYRKKAIAEKEAEIAAKASKYFA